MKKRFWCKAHNAFHEGQPWFHKKTCIAEFVVGDPIPDFSLSPTTKARAARQLDVVEFTALKVGYRLIHGFSIMRMCEDDDS
ncbi:MAG: hypothetical protein GY896_22800 [Gammaproteobacteria bacterium]|nr:hypothetical protein [Gammaproteobacteria bacterium]